MTAAQPNAMQGLAGTTGDTKAADTAEGTGAGGETGTITGGTAQQEAEPQPEYVGDMPDDPERARTYRPGEDEPDGEGR